MANHQECIGETIEDYRLQRWLGKGGFGDVYLAQHIYNHSYVAIKILRAHSTQNRILKTFINEAYTSQFKHSHIVPILSYGITSSDEQYFVMEYAPGGTLRERHPAGSRVPLKQVVEYTIQVASALAYAHSKKIMHLDIKPANMLVREDGSILLSDFGNAEVIHNTASMIINKSPERVGTVTYMAPELLESDGSRPGPESDQYALGIVIYEWLTGTFPFQGTTEQVIYKHLLRNPQSLCEQVPDLPRAVEDVIFKALAKDYKQRFHSIQDFSEALQKASGLVQPPPLLEATTPPSPAIHNEPTVSLDPIVPKPLRKPWVSLTVAISLLLAFIAIIGSYTYAAKVADEAAKTKATAQAVIDANTMSATATSSVKAAFNAYENNVDDKGIMFGFDAQNKRNNPYEHVLSPSNLSQVKDQWEADTHGIVDSSPAVANGIVYVGSRAGALYAFDAHTGKQRWRFPETISVPIADSSPAISKGVVYIGFSNGSLCAIDANTGVQKWRKVTGGFIDSSPVIVDDIVYVASNDHRLYAFDAHTGNTRWSANINGSGVSSPAVSKGVVYIGSENGNLYAFRASDGHLQWAKRLNGPIDSSPSIVDDIVSISTLHGALYALDAQTGNALWSNPPTKDFLKSSPAVADGLIYVGSNDQKLYAFDAKTGVQKWSANTNGFIASSPMVANGVVYVGSGGGNLYAFDARTGGKLWEWQVPTKEAINSSPMVANGVIYAGSRSGKLYAFSLPESNV